MFISTNLFNERLFFPFKQNTFMWKEPFITTIVHTPIHKVMFETRHLVMFNDELEI